MKQHRLFSLFLILLVSLLVGHAQSRAPKGSPAPDGYLITPYGYFHSSCVKQLNDGDVIKDETIQRANGAVDSTEACAYSHFTARGEEVVPGDRDPKITHSWIVAVDTAPVNPKGSFGELVTEWEVPPAPKTNHGQTIYFFPGLEDYKDVVTILQPVLGRNAYYKEAWGIASWNCCVKGTVYVSNPRPTATGHIIGGGIKDNCKPGTVECKSWDVVTEDLTTGVGTELANTSNFKQTFNWAFTSALEVYNIVDCSDYPAGGKLYAGDIHLYNDNFKSIPLTDYAVLDHWQLLRPGSVSPACGRNATEANKFQEITLDF
jgi:hypothetical protein